MGCKTILKHLLSKYGILSIDMQEAIIKDQAVLKDDNVIEYVDNDNSNLEVEQQIEEKVEKVVTPKKATLNDIE